MISLFFDTETTGKADFKAAPDAKHQPRLVQIGAILQDDQTLKVYGEINLIVQPKAFTIPKEASDVHGITTEIATQYGVPLIHALEAFGSLAKRCEQYVCHNSEFDLIVMTGEAMRMIVPWWAKESFCTMKATTPICKLPGPYGFKWPKLQEAHKHAFGKEFDGAHDAMADVRACRDLYLWLKKEARAAA